MSICWGILHSDGVFSGDEVCQKQLADAKWRHFTEEAYQRERVSACNVRQSHLTADGCRTCRDTGTALHCPEGAATVGSEEAPNAPGWPPSAAQTQRADFPHWAFTKVRCQRSTWVGSTWPTCAPVVRFQSHVSSDTDFWVFHIRNLSTSVPLLAYQLLPPNHLCPPPSPAHVAAFMRSRRFHDASSTIRRSDYSPGIASHFAPRLCAAPTR